jgi:hypothetical protein
MRAFDISSRMSRRRKEIQSLDENEAEGEKEICG